MDQATPFDAKQLALGGAIGALACAAAMFCLWAFDVVPAEEMIRWTTPVKSFMRVATEDTQIRGQRMAANDSVLLAYPSANFDEEVFDDPYRFDIGRDPNRHLAFGHGIHFCLGAQLARMEIRAFLAELAPRLQDIQIAGEPQLIKTLFVGGLKHLPVRSEVH